MFIPENEDMDSIIEVLQHLKNENPDWKPKNMMVDMSAAEIGAIESCFPGRFKNVFCQHKGIKNGKRKQKTVQVLQLLNNLAREKSA